MRARESWRADIDVIDEEPPEDPYEPSTPRVDEAVVAEQSTLGGMLLSPRVLAECLKIVAGPDFNVPKHELIFDAIHALTAAGAPVDVITVTDELLRTGELQRAGGADYLHSLTSIVPTAANAGYYATLVRRRALQRQMLEVGHRLQQSPADEGVAIARAIEDLRQLQHAGAAGPGQGVVWLRDLLDAPEEDDAYDWVIPGVLERQDRLMLSAGEGVGKTWMLRQLAMLSAAGLHPFQFSPIDPVQVLVVDAENSERQWRRSARRLAETAAQRGRRDPRAHLAVRNEPVMDITRPDHIGRIHRWMDEVRPDLVVLGPLYRMTGGSLNSDDEVGPVLQALDTIRERGVAMLIEVHAGHARSTSGERELRPRGSSALLGWPEFGLGLRRDKTFDGGRVTFSLVRWRGDRDARQFPSKFVRGQVWPWEPTVGV